MKTDPYRKRLDYRSFRTSCLRNPSLGWPQVRRARRQRSRRQPGNPTRCVWMRICILRPIPQADLDTPKVFRRIDYLRNRRLSLLWGSIRRPGFVRTSGESWTPSLNPRGLIGTPCHNLVPGYYCQIGSAIDGPCRVQGHAALWSNAIVDCGKAVKHIQDPAGS